MGLFGGGSTKVKNKTYTTTTYNVDSRTQPTTNIGMTLDTSEIGRGIQAMAKAQAAAAETAGDTVTMVVIIVALTFVGWKTWGKR